MRITNSMMIDRVVTNLNNGLNKANKYNMQLSSNRKITRLSDDPIGVLSSMQARQSIRQVNRYQDNIIAAREWVEQSETALTDIEGVLITIKETLIDAISIENKADKMNFAVQIKSYVDHIGQTLNATASGQYIFAGFNTTNQPFVRENDTMMYNGINLETATPAAIQPESDQIIEFEIGYEIKLDVTFTGDKIVGTGENNLFKILDDIVADLQAGAENSQLSQHLDKLEAATDVVRTNIVEAGVKYNKLELMSNRYDIDAINYEQVRTDIEDIDQAETIMHMLMSQTIYQQALGVGARVIQPTLMDFLN